MPNVTVHADHVKALASAVGHWGKSETCINWNVGLTYLRVKPMGSFELKLEPNDTIYPNLDQFYDFKRIKVSFDVEYVLSGLSKLRDAKFVDFVGFSGRVFMRSAGTKTPKISVSCEHSDEVKPVRLDKVYLGKAMRLFKAFGVSSVQMEISDTLEPVLFTTTEKDMDVLIMPVKKSTPMGV
jgi:hypothetical protein